MEADSIDADLFLWDADNRLAADHGWENHANPRAIEQMFAISRENLQDFLQKLPLGAGSTLLKPVAAGPLRVFLEQALARHQSRAEDSDQDNNDRDLLQCLLMANLKLQEYDQDRTNFLARAVHDFRAPLTAASGYCGLLHEQLLGSLNTD